MNETRPLPRAAAPGYRPRRSLPLRVEAIRQLRRRRTLWAFVLLCALPWLLVLAFEVRGTSSSGGATPSIIELGNTSGLNFAAFTLFVSASFLLVVAVALFCGDTVAGEAGWASLRYLLAAPVPRTRLLRQKMIVSFGYAGLSVVVLPLMATLAGTIAFGWHDMRLPGGEALAPGAALARMAIVVGYTLVSQLVVAALAFLFSVTTDSPLGAVGGAVGLVIVSTIMDAVTALGGWRDFLPTHWAFAWTDALGPRLEVSGMAKGTALSVAYAIVLYALAIRRFRGKDIVS